MSIMAYAPVVTEAQLTSSRIPENSTFHSPLQIKQAFWPASGWYWLPLGLSLSHSPHLNAPAPLAVPRGHGLGTPSGPGSKPGPGMQARAVLSLTTPLH